MSDIELIWNEGRVVPENDITLLEQYFKVELPQDFKEFIKINDGANPNLKALDFSGMVEKVFSGLLPVREENDYSEPIIDIIEDLEENLPSFILPFGEDPFGNLYCFDYRNVVTPIIVYWDHDLDLDEPKQFLLVANSFTELQEKLYLPKRR